MQRSCNKPQMSSVLCYVFFVLCYVFFLSVFYVMYSLSQLPFGFIAVLYHQQRPKFRNCKTVIYFVVFREHLQSNIQDRSRLWQRHFLATPADLHDTF